MKSQLTPPLTPTRTRDSCQYYVPVIDRLEATLSPIYVDNGDVLVLCVEGLATVKDDSRSCYRRTSGLFNYLLFTSCIIKRGAFWFQERRLGLWERLPMEAL
jgi:hypothetical protein